METKELKSFHGKSKPRIGVYFLVPVSHYITVYCIFIAALNDNDAFLIIQLIKDQTDKDTTELKIQLNQCKNQLQKTTEEFQSCKINHSKLDHAKSEEIACLTNDVGVKKKYIQEIEHSYNETLGMLQQSQKRISALEENLSNHSDDISSEKLANEESRREIEVLHQKICDQQKDIELYQGQVDRMNDALEDAKDKFKVTA